MARNREREGERHARISELKFVYRCRNGRYNTTRGNARRELSRAVVIIISGSIATRDGKLTADYIRVFPGVPWHESTAFSYSASRKGRGGGAEGERKVRCSTSYASRLNEIMRTI